MGYFQRPWLFFHTIRYLSLNQVRYRVRRMVHVHWRKLVGLQAPQPNGWVLRHYRTIYEGLSDILLQGPWAEGISLSVESAKQVSKHHFTFLHHSRHFKEKILWNDPGLSQLWRYHLHYFDFVNDLLIWSQLGHTKEAYGAFKGLVDSWINGNKKLKGDGWHPYTVSLRLVNWVNALSTFRPQLSQDKLFYDRFVSSIFGQGRILARDLELDVRGNHLLKNLKALIWLGIVFKGPEPRRWLDMALRLFERELSEQVLPDGGHFERCPGYHLVVLKDLLEIGLWLKRNHYIVGWLDNSVGLMLDYLAALLPPDHEVPLLKDTTWDVAPKARDLLNAGALYLDESRYACSNNFGLYPLLLFGFQGWSRFKSWKSPGPRPRDSVALMGSGYYIMRDDVSRDYLIFDAGKPCPDYLPAHAHADMLSYELVVEGRHVLVDPGVYEYTEGPWRDYFRSTRAHNTVEVAGVDQSQVWGSFRVARRARPGKVLWRLGKEYAVAHGEHDGYSRLSPPVKHRRTIVWHKNCFWLIVDELLGEGRTACRNRMHFHPQILLKEFRESIWEIQGSACSLWLSANGEGSHSVVKGQFEPSLEGWYSDSFGRLEPNTVLSLNSTGNLPHFYAYAVSKNLPVEIKLTSNPNEEIDVDVLYDQHHYKVKVEPSGVSYFQ
jgi:uncharacterized heparinase superfamily protein